MKNNTLNSKITKIIIGAVIAIILGALTIFKIVPDIAMNDQINAAVDYYLVNEGEEISDANHKIVSGDYVNIDYKGTINGKAFDGGTTEGYVLQIGSNSFIDGFEQQLIGHKKGQTVDVKITFPKDYSVESLAGQKAVFKVKINKVMKKAKLTDNYAKGLGLEGVKDVKSFKDYIRKALEQQKKQQQQQPTGN